MNAIDLLIQDHKLVKKLLEELSTTIERAVKKRAELLHRIKQALQIHTTLEEEILYPAFKQAGGKEEAKMYYEAKEEHRTVDALVLPDLLHTETGTVEFAARVKVMKELLEHHNDWRLKADARLSGHLVEAFGKPARSFPARLPMLRLDRIYLRNAQACEARVLSRYPWSHLSDHAPLVAQVTL